MLKTKSETGIQKLPFKSALVKSSLGFFVPNQHTENLQYATNELSQNEMSLTVMMPRVLETQKARLRCKTVSAKMAQKKNVSMVRRDNMVLGIDLPYSEFSTDDRSASTSLFRTKINGTLQI